MRQAIETSQVIAGKCASQAHSCVFSNSRQTYVPKAPHSSLIDKKMRNLPRFLPESNALAGVFLAPTSAFFPWPSFSAVFCFLRARRWHRRGWPPDRSLPVRGDQPSQWRCGTPRLDQCRGSSMSGTENNDSVYTF